MKHVIVELKKA